MSETVGQKQRERERDGKIQTERWTKSERQRVNLSLSQLAVFQVITQVLPFSFSLSLLLPLKVTLTAHIRSTEGTNCVGIQRHMYSITKLPF